MRMSWRTSMYHLLPVTATGQLVLPALQRIAEVVDTLSIEEREVQRLVQGLSKAMTSNVAI